MKKKFVVTSNVKRFVVAVNGILEAPGGLDRMALIYGDPGLGKTESALWFMNECEHYDVVFIRTKKLMTGRWLLEELVRELGETPATRTSDLFEQAVESLTVSQTLVLLDEVDYLTPRTLETIRDIHDLSNAPFVMIGMDKADITLQAFRPLWRRFSQVVKFHHLDKKDITALIKEISEVKIDNTAIEYIMSTANVARKNTGFTKGKKKISNMTVANVYRWVHKAERLARTRKLSVITAKDLKNKPVKKEPDKPAPVKDVKDKQPEQDKIDNTELRN